MGGLRERPSDMHVEHLLITVQGEDFNVGFVKDDGSFTLTGLGLVEKKGLGFAEPIQDQTECEFSTRYYSNVEF